jgi:hypothetical protein
MMYARDYWQLFLETGAPEAYMAYSKAKLMEECHVPDNQSIGLAGHGLQ